MNEQLQQAMSQIITKSLAGIDKAADFMVTQLPDVIQQLLRWRFVHSLFYFVLGWMLMLISIYGGYRFWRWVFLGWKAREVRDDYGINVALAMSGGMVHFIFLIMACVNIFNLEWVYIWVAPKAWLIEYASKIMK
jgi:hypothetical protein